MERTQSTDAVGKATNGCHEVAVVGEQEKFGKRKREERSTEKEQHDSDSLQIEKPKKYTDIDGRRN